jgi:hypothetical protein
VDEVHVVDKLEEVERAEGVHFHDHLAIFYSVILHHCTELSFLSF